MVPNSIIHIRVDVTYRKPERLDFIVDTLCVIRVPEVLCGNPPWPGGQLLQRISYNRTQPQPRAVPGSLHKCRLRTEWYQTVSSIFGSMLRTVSQSAWISLWTHFAESASPRCCVGTHRRQRARTALAALRHRGVR